MGSPVKRTFFFLVALTFTILSLASAVPSACLREPDEVPNEPSDCRRIKGKVNFPQGLKINKTSPRYHRQS